VRHKVLNVEEIQLTFRSYLTVTLVEAVSLELDVKKCVSGFTVKIPYPSIFHSCINTVSPSSRHERSLLSPMYSEQSPRTVLGQLGLSSDFAQTPLGLFWLRLQPNLKIQV
jgi:hypothetical protein